MRYSPELAARAQAWLARPLTNTPEGRRSAEGLLELATVWAAIQNVPLPACIRQCQYSDRVHDVNAYLREYARFTSLSSPMATADAQQATYQFKPEYAGQTLTADDYSKAVTQDNLTDEDAEHFIRKGFGHVFQKISTTTEGGSSSASGESLEVEPTNPLVPETDLNLEQAAHQETRQALAGEKAAYEKLLNQYDLTEENRQQQVNALASEKQAHATTKQQLSSVQQQLADAQATITKLKAKAKPAAVAAPALDQLAADSVPTNAAPVSSPTAGTDASADAANGSN